MFSLEDKVALITGSSRGIGEAIARAMADAGARVVVSSRKADACDAVAGSIRDAGGEAIAIPCNVSHRDQIQSLVDRTRDHWGRIDVLVCNAAVNPHFGPSQEIGEDAFDKVMTTNVKNVLWLCRAVIPGMRERGHGRVINLTGVTGRNPDPSRLPSSTAAIAMLNLTKAIADEFAPHGVTINALSPGSFERAELTVEGEAGGEGGGSAPSAPPVPAGRAGTPAELADALLFLASDRASYVTGASLTVDGGRTRGI